MGMLRFLPLEIHLLVVGEGSERNGLEQFSRDTDVASRVHFLGAQAELAPFLHACQLAWIPSRAEGGRNFALEAMTAGRPVIATRLLGLATMVVDGETGFLIPPGDRALLSRRTKELLLDARLRQRLGEAAHRRAAEHFAAADLVRRCGALYENGQVRQAG
jgi:glycosyltransferase involved in cell wall biosynthesis